MKDSINLLDEASKGFTYTEYLAFVKELSEAGATSGDEQTKERIDATLLNVQRMQRLNKTILLTPSMKQAIYSMGCDCLWLVISESWCGDGAQNIPVLNKIAEASAGKIELKIILRDENPKIMDRFLSGFARSIPKLICVNKTDGSVMAIWGPRPTFIVDLIEVFKKENPSASHEYLIYQLHLWYARDKGHGLQEDIERLISCIALKPCA